MSKLTWKIEGEIPHRKLAARNRRYTFEITEKGWWDEQKKEVNCDAEVFYDGKRHSSIFGSLTSFAMFRCESDYPLNRYEGNYRDRCILHLSRFLSVYHDSTGMISEFGAKLIEEAAVLVEEAMSKIKDMRS